MRQFIVKRGHLILSAVLAIPSRIVERGHLILSAVLAIPSRSEVLSDHHKIIRKLPLRLVHVVLCLDYYSLLHAKNSLACEK